MSADTLTPFAFDALPVRGALIRLGSVWQRLQSTLGESPLLRETLGQAAAASCLIAHSLKFEGSITLQIQGAEVLNVLVMQCTDELDMRGLALLNDGRDASTFAELTKGAHCAITVDAGDRPYQGIVAIQDESLSSSLEHYFEKSVQVPSHLVLVTNAESAAGLLLQQMPGEPIDADDWNRLGFLAATLNVRDFVDGDDVSLLKKLFPEDDVRVYAQRAPRFHCRCSERRVEDVLRMLGEKETRAVLEERETLEVICEYCGETRHYDAVDIERVFQSNVVSGPDPLQ